MVACGSLDISDSVRLFLSDMHGVPFGLVKSLDDASRTGDSSTIDQAARGLTALSLFHATMLLFVTRWLLRLATRTEIDGCQREKFREQCETASKLFPVDENAFMVQHLEYFFTQCYPTETRLLDVYKFRQIDRSAASREKSDINSVMALLPMACEVRFGGHNRLDKNNCNAIWTAMQDQDANRNFDEI